MGLTEVWTESAPHHPGTDLPPPPAFSGLWLFSLFPPRGKTHLWVALWSQPSESHAYHPIFSSSPQPPTQVLTVSLIPRTSGFAQWCPFLKHVHRSLLCLTSSLPESQPFKFSPSPLGSVHMYYTPHVHSWPLSPVRWGNDVHPSGLQEDQRQKKTFLPQCRPHSKALID